MADARMLAETHRHLIAATGLTDRSYDFESRIRRILESPAGARASLALGLYDELRASSNIPLVVEDRVWFFFIGNSRSVGITGDWTRWGSPVPLVRIEGTDLFLQKFEFPPTSRLQYKLVVDGEYLIDPGNARVAREGFGVNSEFWMSDYRDEAPARPPGPVVERGVVSAHSFRSRILGEQRQMFLYTPPARYIEGPLPLLLVHDGAEALEIGDYHHILDTLVNAQRVPACAALFLPPRERNAEYALNMDYAHFSVREAVPKATAIWRRRGIIIDLGPHRRCVLGASLGGLLATATALRWPEVFGACIAQSPAYWWERGAIFSSPDFANSPRLRVILQTGTICDAREMTQLMYQKLALAGAHVSYHEYAQGHTWGNWRSNVAEAIEEWIGDAGKEGESDG